MLTVDPEQRTTVRQILGHPWMKDIASQVCTPFTSANDLALGSGSRASLLFCAGASGEADEWSVSRRGCQPGAGCLAHTSRGRGALLLLRRGQH